MGETQCAKCGFHREWGRETCTQHTDELIAQQAERIAEAQEIYTGMEGFNPETAPEAYCLRIIEQMYAALTPPTIEGNTNE